MMVTDILHRVRSHLAMPGVTKAGLATKAGLHPNTLRDADQESWNPTAATLKALEPHLPLPKADWPLPSADNAAETIGAAGEADSPRPFLEGSASELTSSSTCPSCGGSENPAPHPCSTGPEPVAEAAE